MPTPTRPGPTSCCLVCSPISAYLLHAVRVPSRKQVSSRCPVSNLFDFATQTLVCSICFRTILDCLSSARHQKPCRFSSLSLIVSAAATHSPHALCHPRLLDGFFPRLKDGEASHPRATCNPHNRVALIRPSRWAEAKWQI